jgi:aspartate/methionine/tyrosine aminotransferase
MEIADFELERYLARWEFDVGHLLCASDPEPVPMRELLELADLETERLWGDLRLGYTESAGHPLLRAEIARTYDHVAPEQVLVCSGAQEAIFLVLGTMLGPGDHAVVVWPSYQSLHEVARASGAEVTLLPLEHDHGWALDLDRLRAELRPTTKVVVVNFPHSPTGALPPRSALQELVGIAERHGAWLVSDEVYRLLELDPAERWPAAVDGSARALSIDVMTKSFGLGGLRIGWVACRDRELLGRLLARKDYTTICNSAPSEILALIGLRAADRLLERTMTIIRSNLRELDRFFAEQSDWIEWVRPRAGTIGFPRLRSGIDADAFAASLVEAVSVLLLPGSIFGHHGSHVRLGFGRRDLPEGLPALARFGASYADRAARQRVVHTPSRP